jgi:hypothetical protein
MTYCGCLSLLLAGCALQTPPAPSGSLNEEGCPSPTTIANGVERSDSLSSHDCAYLGQYFKAYYLNGEAGHQYLLSVHSSEFPPEVVVYQPVGPLIAHIADERATEGDTTAQVAFTAANSGRYLVAIAPVTGSKTGHFALSVNDLGLAEKAIDDLTASADVTRDSSRRESPQVEWIEVGGESAGTLDSEDALLGAFPHDLWNFRTAQTQRVRVELASTSFSPRINVGSVVGSKFEPSLHGLDANDTLAIVTLDAIDAGEYTIAVNASSERQAGPYRIRIRALPAQRAQPLTRRTRVGEQVAGELTESDTQLEDGSHYQDWLFTAGKDETIEIQLSSNDFDPYLIAGQWMDEKFFEFARDDDGAGGKNARLVIITPVAGDYLIRVNTFGLLQLGKYQLQLRRLRQ